MNDKDHKLDILILADYYLPGHNAGGPIWSLSNLVEHLGEEFNFRIITRDRDLGCDEPYRLEESTKWHAVGNAMVCYLSPEQRSLKLIRKLLDETHYDIIYLTTLFSPCFAIKPMLLHKWGMTKNKAIIIAPMGQLSQNALKLKACKKRSFLSIARFIGLYNDVTWHASSNFEADDICNVFGRTTQPFISIVPNIPGVIPPRGNSAPANTKIPHHLNIIYLSRISPMKNLNAALKMLQGLCGSIDFDLYGPIEDKGYWDECQRLIQLLPANIKVEYRGVVPHDNVEHVMANYHLFLLPTLGENFSHAILEALSAGCPVLISDRTPWRNLAEKGVGWDVPLEDEKQFRRLLQHCIDMDNDAMTKLSISATNFAYDYCSNNGSLELFRELFRSAVVGSSY